MAGTLAQVMNVDVLGEILQENAPAHEVVDSLLHKGVDLAEAVEHKVYKNYEDFVNTHVTGKSQLVELEGESSLDENMIILHGCPMFDEVKKLYTDGKPPESHGKIVNEFMDQNPGTNALLHPGCIVHQVARQMIVHSIKFEDGTGLSFYQIACRSMGTGKVVYDEKGMAVTNLSKEAIDKMIDGYACLYILVNNKGA
jgi:hypothetical protein